MEENNTWECYLCSSEHGFEDNPIGYLANFHPLCLNCANDVLTDKNNQNHFRLTFHEKIGDLKIIGNIPVENNFLILN
jgi:hypothetical protein